jgi:uncharacterized UPF0160 family protein
MAFVAQFVGRNLAQINVTSALPAAGTVSSKVIGTHDGSFHCDEALACGLLRHTALFKDAHIVRTRAQDVLDACDAAVDVGAVYDFARLRLDHHQKEFQDTMTTAVRAYNTRLSSAGIVYRHFGAEVIKAYAAACIEAGRLSAAPSDKDVDAVFDRVYRNFIEHVDGIDNGVEAFSGGVRNYEVPTTLSARVGRLAPRWNEPGGADAYNAGFVDAVRLATVEFFGVLDEVLCAWLPGRSIVEAAFANRSETHSSGRIMAFDGLLPPWKDHLIDIENAAGATESILYVLYPDGTKGWRVQCVPKGGSGFANRKSLQWKGLRDATLVAASGVEGATFVHVTGFIGGCSSYEGALAMAVKSLEAESE